MGGCTAPWKSTPMSTPSPCSSRRARRCSTAASMARGALHVLVGLARVDAGSRLHRRDARLVADRAVDAHAVAGGSAQQPVDGHAEALAGDVPQGLVDPGEDRRLDRAAAVEGAPVDGLPVMGHGARVLAHEVVGDFQCAGGAGPGVVLEHLPPAADAGVGGDLHEDPRVAQDEGLDRRDLDRLVRADRSLAQILPIRDFRVLHVALPCQRLRKRTSRPVSALR